MWAASRPDPTIRGGSQRQPSLRELATLPAADTVLVAVVGTAGLQPTLDAILRAEHNRLAIIRVPQQIFGIIQTRVGEKLSARHPVLAQEAVALLTNNPAIIP